MTIFFAWVDPTETTFNPSVHNRVDENVFKFDISHEEGQMPTCDVVIKNPQAGLLNPSRKQWAWVSTDVTGSIEPLFFGRLLGIPTDLMGYQVTLRFISKALDYIAQKWALADTLQVLPYYDPIFLSPEAQIDPDSVLEGYSAAYHVDRTTLEWSISDILEGEDGTLDFGVDQILFGSLSMDVKESALRAVRVDATVHWRQWFRGQVVEIYHGNVASLTANSLADSWPKFGESLGGGWKAAWPTWARAVGGDLGSYEEQGSWQDQNQKHNEGDTIAAQWSVSIPYAPGYDINLQHSEQYGNIGSTTTVSGVPNSSFPMPDFGGGGGSPTNTSNPNSGFSLSYSRIVIWKAFLQLWITPDGTPNNFTETFSFTLNADIQHLLSDANAQSETEVITLEGQDVGEAVFDYKAWTNVKGTYVGLGQIILPNMQVGPGGLSFQIVVTPGTLGTTAPLYSDVPGNLTTDGSAVLACIGSTLPSISDWSPYTYYRAGQIICLDSNGGYFFLCNQEGTTGEFYPFPYYVLVPDPSTPPMVYPPAFPPVSPPPSFGSSFGDNGVVWTSLGAGGTSLATPINGTPGNITASAFFSTERGTNAVSAAIMRARAKMRTRARAFEISATVPFKDGLSLSCRKNATITSPIWNGLPLIPGGVASGKVIKYSLTGDGESGEFLANFTIGCAVGNAGTAYSNADGTGLYVSEGYVQPGWQATTGRVISHDDVAFTPPPPNWTTAFFTAPLTKNQVVLSEAWKGSVAYQARLANMIYSQSVSNGYEGIQRRAQQASYKVQWAQYQLSTEAGSYYYELKLKPISGLSWSTPYIIDVQDLRIPKQIDLGA
jgi:hypothetical protein